MRLTMVATIDAYCHPIFTRTGTSAPPTTVIALTRKYWFFSFDDFLSYQPAYCSIRLLIYSCSLLVGWGLFASGIYASCLQKIFRSPILAYYISGD